MKLGTLGAFLLWLGAFGIACAQAAEQWPLGTRADITNNKFKVGSFRHMDQLFPYRVIRRSGPVSDLPRAARRLNVTYDWAGQTRKLADLLERTKTTGFLVIKDGRIVFEKYYLGANEQSRFTSMSVAKSFTSTLVGLAIADGLIASVDRPVADYVPELKGSGYEGVPIKAILQMSSGVKFTEDYSGNDDVMKMWARCMVRNEQPLDNYARSLPFLEPPGRRFYYRSVDTQVLGWLVSRVTGKHPADYLAGKIWGPLGAEHDATWLTDATGMEATFCCINATLRDYGRFGLLFLNQGRWGGHQLVPPGWVTGATIPDSPQVQPGKLFPGSPLGYQFQWWTFPGPDHAFSAEGIFFQFIYVNPKDNLVIVKTSAFDRAWDDKLEPETYAAFRAIAAALRTR